ncbi:MAG TPA: hypothetical protein VK750_05290 [Cytophagaceae bacterium]|jgi:hypothetical protein|nr:hypothetical protein [Cytophagaceae bacterium]
MKIIDSILLACSAAFLLIGVHQAMKYGVQNSYFFFMMASGFFLWYTLRKKKAEEEKNKKNTPTPKGKK